MLKAAVVFLMCVSVSFAAVSLQPLEDKPKEFANEKGCYISELKKVIPFGGSEISQKYCQKYNCNEKYVQTLGCGVAAAKPPCCVVQDLALLYPDCCPTIKCNDECPKQADTEECDEETL